jgi:hypothetical protein
MELKNYYNKIAERFLQTAIVIDDQASLGPIVTKAPPARIVEPSKGLLDASEPAAVPTLGVNIEQDVDPSTSSLNAKVLTEAFLARKMICALYRPSPGENMVQCASGAAEAADVVVVDWHLEPGSSRGAKDIVLQLLRSDRAEKGRLRLIAIYTAQSGRDQIAKELFDEIQKVSELTGRLKLDGEALRSLDTRIVILNKRNTLGLDAGMEVKEADLPGRLVSEFAELAQSILAGFALASVTAVRRGVHHVLALYTSDLDGAFVSHRCGLPNPDDANNFAVDLITSELRNLIEIEDVAAETLGPTLLTAWIKSQKDSGTPFKSGGTSFSAEQLAELVSGKQKDSDNASPSRDTPELPNPSKKAKANPDCAKLAKLFYPALDDTRRGVWRLARLSTFQREAGRSRFPERWLPLLTLGSVLQKRTESGDGELLLCVQPRCDSVRLDGKTAFPFQRITHEEYDFNLILRNLKGAECEVWVNLKPRDTRIVDFNPDDKRKVVLGRKDGENEQYLFEAADADKSTYEWLGDLKEMKAQVWAGAVGARFQSVGIDEFEFLRSAGERKIKRNWA